MERDPHTQEDVEFDVLEVLRHGRIMTTQEVTKAVKSRLSLASADLQRANKRDHESKIDQIIANALQAKRHLCRDGLIERVGRGEFRITEIGRADIAERDARAAEAGALLDQMLSDDDED